ncbi:hypothetical protein CAEBREN_24101 [Caenorhabditis brenneri]|uniref:Uncharacterized protein n=1 Tax=Caenorhabditis brenneri TaxID=135651 RepID=G0NQS3_CAEBE|nr:hypothetical protein CAEBREN_24101 [Caenorhabditis brenneri]
MNLSESKQVVPGDENDGDEGVQVVEQEDIPVIEVSKNREKLVNFDKATETQRKEHERRRCDYKSPKKPNGHISREADNGPTTDFVDLSLKEGHEALAQFPPPLTAHHEHVRDQVLFWKKETGRLSFLRYHLFTVFLSVPAKVNVYGLLFFVDSFLNLIYFLFNLKL